MNEEVTRVLPQGMLRRNYGKGGRGGAYYMRLRIITDPRCVAQTVDLGLGTRNLREAQMRAVNLLNAMDVLGWRYCCRIVGNDGVRIAYDDIRTWKQNLKKAFRSQCDLTPEDAPCQPMLPGLESFSDHE